MRFRAYFRISKFTKLHNSFIEDKPYIDLKANGWDDAENGAMLLMMKVCIQKGWVLRSIELIGMVELSNPSKERKYSKLL